MQMIEVDSTAIERIGWETGMMDVHFKDGRSYRYYGIPESVYEEVLDADSIGRAFNIMIKDKYEYMDTTDIYYSQYVS